MTSFFNTSKIEYALMLKQTGFYTISEIREIVHIVEFGHCQLADIGNAVDSMRFVARFVQSRQQNSGKNRNNRNGYQEFYKRKIQMPPEAESSCFHSQNSLIDVGETDIWEPSPDF